MNTHQKYINRCFQIAEKGRGQVKSNPLVGAVLVCEDKIISEGYYQKYGGPHAEVNCLQEVNDKDVLASSTLYVSLEPCCIEAKTPPCTNFIIEKGIRKVVIGSLDFNPEVRGKGLALLEANGIQIHNLNLEDKQRELNISFFINQFKNEPYFIGKLALSNDEYIGREGERVKITSREIDTLSHKLRASVDLIIVGKNTWLRDRPRLDSRYFYSINQPDIAVLSNKDLKISPNQTKNRLIHVISETNPKKLQDKIYGLGYRNILVEGGAEVFKYFMNNGLFHEFHLIKNTKLEIENGLKAPEIDCSRYNENQVKFIQNHFVKSYLKIE